MTEQPDTTAIRAEYRNLERQGVRVPRSAFLLLDALDAARGARDYWRNRNIDLKRQEATNAALLAGAYEVSRKALDRGEAAEARIAKALAALDDLGGVARKAEVFTALHHVRRTLTEGTGQ